VVDKNGDTIEVEGSKEGQLAISGPAVMTKYEILKDEEKAKDDTRQKLRGTWLYTGDIFRIDDSGEDVTLQFLARMDGLNPVPKLEDAFSAAKGDKALRAIEGLVDCHVFREHGDRGDICAAVVLVEGTELTPFQIMDRTQGALTPKNRIAKVIRVNQIPRTAEGKVDPDAMAAEVAKGYVPPEPADGGTPQSPAAA
jgi:acyl-coenzyme A synthetase/AMP-(fatty) acid ligase